MQEFIYITEFTLNNQQQERGSMKSNFILPLCFLIIFFSPDAAFSLSLISLRVGNGNSGSDVTFDLSSTAGFPPQVYPTCYYPSTGTQSNPDGVSINVRIINIFGQTISNAYLDVRASYNPSSTITCDQIYWTVVPTSLPKPGTEPQPPWHPFSLTWENVAKIPIIGTSISRQYNMDMCFKLEADDNPTPPQGVSTTIYIRFYGL